MAKKDTKTALTEAFDENDVTKAPQAMSQEDVNNQDTRTRLWQSLDQSYGQQREQIDKSYAQAISQTDRAMQNRGMQRSSYAMQTLANLGQEQAKANADSMASQIADYQNRLNTLEQQEQQFNYQKERDQIADQQWQQQFDTQKEQWKQQFDYQKMSAQQQLSYNYLMNMLETGDNPSDALLKQAGISRNDYEQMKKAAATTGKSGRSGGTPLWKQLGFNSEAEYNNYLAQQGASAGTGAVGSTFSAIEGYNKPKTEEERKQPQGMVGARLQHRYYDVIK